MKMNLILLITGLVLVFANDECQVDEYITEELIAELATEGITREQLRKYLEPGSLEVHAVLCGVYKIFNIELPPCLANDDHLQEYLYRTPDYQADKILDTITDFFDLMQSFQ